MKKDVENMKEYVKNMKKYVNNWIWYSHIYMGLGTWKNFQPWT